MDQATKSDEVNGVDDDEGKIAQQCTLRVRVNSQGRLPDLYQDS